MNTMNPIPTVKQAPLRGHTVLIVEDTPDIGLRLSTFLRRRGGASAVEIVASVARAQARLRREPHPTVALIDHHIYDGYGATLATWAREQPRLQDLLLISFSAQPPETILRAARGPDLFDAIITKGEQSFDTILAQLSALVGSRHIRSMETSG